MKIALCQINPTIGDICGNIRLISTGILRAKEAGAQLAVFPEMSLCGYPPRDLLMKPDFLDACEKAVQELADNLPAGMAAVVGLPVRNGAHAGKPLFNSLAVLEDGRVTHWVHKRLLPTYDVFDEYRWFEPGPMQEPVTLFGHRVGLTICEDMWNDAEVFPRPIYHANPVAELVAEGAEFIINASASPFTLGKPDFRRKLLGALAKKHQVPIFYCNQVGGNDDLVFDGRSFAVDAQGDLLREAKAFQEDLLLVDAHETPARHLELDDARENMRDLFDALVLGLRDYMVKCGFKQVVLGLSGGIDSALCAALSVAALGAENVRGMAMPSRFSSDHSICDARELAHRLGIAFDIIPIEPAHAGMEDMLTRVFAGRAPDLTEENIQARLRGVILMAMSNKFGSMLVTTGNKSELAVGYCTLYGDMCGGLALISDVPKTLVWDLSRWINDSPDSPLRQSHGGPVIPANSIDKVPSAELRPNQTDQDSLPPYADLDAIVERYVERDQPVEQIVAETQLDEAVVRRIVRLIDLAEYKRRQAAPGIKVTGRAFGSGRRMPIAQRFR